MNYLIINSRVESRESIVNVSANVLDNVVSTSEVQHSIAELTFVLKFRALNRRELRKHFVLWLRVVRVLIRVIAI